MNGVVGVGRSAPKAGALPGCATPRHAGRLILSQLVKIYPTVIGIAVRRPRLRIRFVESGEAG